MGMVKNKTRGKRRRTNYKKLWEEIRVSEINEPEQVNRRFSKRSSKSVNLIRAENQEFTKEKAIRGQNRSDRSTKLAKSEQSRAEQRREEKRREEKGSKAHTGIVPHNSEREAHRQREREREIERQEERKASAYCFRVGASPNSPQHGYAEHRVEETEA